MTGYYVCVMIFTACLSSWVICLLRKVGFIEWVQVHGNDFFHKLFSCDFCLSWWTCCVLTVLWMLVTGEVDMMYMPFIGTMISRFLL